MVKKGVLSAAGHSWRQTQSSAIPLLSNTQARIAVGQKGESKKPLIPRTSKFASEQEATETEDSMKKHRYVMLLDYSSLL